MDDYERLDFWNKKYKRREGSLYYMKIKDKHKHFIKYLKVIDKRMVVPALDNCLKLNIITKRDYKVILKEVLNEGDSN